MDKNGDSESDKMVNAKVGKLIHLGAIICFLNEYEERTAVRGRFERKKV
jgi:hypothetical protein